MLCPSLANRTRSWQSSSAVGSLDRFVLIHTPDFEKPNLHVK